MKPKFKVGDIVAVFNMLGVPLATKIEEVVIAEKAVLYRVRFRDGSWEYKVEHSLVLYFEEDSHDQTAT